MNRLRDQFDTISDLAAVINRSPRYTFDRLNYRKPFTEREKKMILAYLGEGFDEKVFE